MKNHLILSTLVCTILLLLNGCIEENESSSNVVGDWKSRSDFEGVARSNAVAFTIGDKAYVCTGYDGEDYLTDLWQYDPALDFWLQKADFPGVSRTSAVAFSVGNKGYVGTGYDGDQELKDFWEYDPTSNSWQQIADFGGSARYGAVAFSLNNRGYVGTGFDGNNLKDFWQYNPENDSWQQIVSIGGSKRIDAVAFVVNSKAYVGTGRHNGVYQYDFWEYDPESLTWTEKKELDEESNYTIARHNAVAFGLDNKGYIGTGNMSNLVADIWEYDPEIDEWTEKTDLEGVAREDAVAFTLQDRAFITTGKAFSGRLDDIWEFLPNEEYDEED